MLWTTSSLLLLGTTYSCAFCAQCGFGILRQSPFFFGFLFIMALRGKYPSLFREVAYLTYAFLRLTLVEHLVNTLNGLDFTFGNFGMPFQLTRFPINTIPFFGGHPCTQSPLSFVGETDDCFCPRVADPCPHFTTISTFLRSIVNSLSGPPGKISLGLFIARSLVRHSSQTSVSSLNCIIKSSRVIHHNQSTVPEQ